MVVRSCLVRQATQHRLPFHHYAVFYNPRHRTFTNSPRRRDDQGIPDHYATLNLQPNASPAEVKKQFYALSKSHHPDLHPNDPAAAQRFVKISEAYATLGSPEKRSRYDRDFLRARHPSSSQNVPSGSFSSASSVGSRPASGLSRRKTQFRGPPPSFYRSGGWGDFSEKRSEHASKASHTYEAQGQAQSNPAGGPAGGAGMGPGGFAAGFDNDVPHFDQRGHYRTQSTIERTRHKARRKRDVRLEGLDDGGAEGSVAMSFVIFSGILAAIFGISAVINGQVPFTRKQKEEKNGHAT